MVVLGGDMDKATELAYNHEIRQLRKENEELKIELAAARKLLWKNIEGKRKAKPLQSSMRMCSK